MTPGKVCLAFGLLSLLAACGGGGATGSGSSGNATPLAITASNQRAVSASARDSDLRSFGGAGSDQVAAAVPVKRRINFLRYPQSHLSNASAQLAQGIEQPSGAVPASGTRQCISGIDPDFPTGGSINISGNNSSLTLLPQADAINVRLNLDLGDNGSVDATDLVSWTSLG